MKITKRQLRRIIREEKARILNEGQSLDDVRDVTVVLDRDSEYDYASFRFFGGSRALSARGSILDPVALRQLADAIEKAMAPDYQLEPGGEIRLEIE